MSWARPARGRPAVASPSPGVASRGHQRVPMAQAVLLLLLACVFLSPALFLGVRADAGPAATGGGGAEGPAGEGVQGGAGSGTSGVGGRGQRDWSGSLSEKIEHYLSDESKWRWPADNAPGTEKLVHSTLLKWCGGSYVEAIRSAEETSRTFQVLHTERSQRYREWMRCKQERAIQERELEVECKRAKQLQQSEAEKDEQTLRMHCETQAVLLRSELEACELKLQSKESAVCRREVEVEKAACAHTQRGLQANLTACQYKGKEASAGRVEELEVSAARFFEDQGAWQRERAQLLATLAGCRPARAHTEARLREVLADGTIDMLETTAMWLQVVLAFLLLLLLVLLGTILWLTLNEEKPVGSGSYGWLGAQKASHMRLLSPDAARGALEDAFEGRTRSRLPVVLTTAVMPEGEAGVPVVFLLIPVNVASSRRFSLFNTGGDYVAHVERAREIVSKGFERSRLVAVLYEGNGSLFSEQTLQSLRLNPDKVAYEAVPKDMDFPKSHNLVVPWLDKALGLRATDSERESDLTATIKVQPWAQYLLMRSGRWGAAHAQL